MSATSVLPRGTASLPKIAVCVLVVILGAVIYGVWRALGFPFSGLLHVVELVVIGWLWADRANLQEKADVATDTSDKALGTAQAAGEDARLAHTAIGTVVQRLADHDTAPAGRHARRPRPTPHAGVQ